MLSSAVLRFRTSISPGRGESLLQKAAAGELGQVGRNLVTRSDALRERCRELEFRAPAGAQVKGRQAEIKFIEEAEPATSVLKEYGFWSLVRLLPFPERDLVRGIHLAEENPRRSDYRAARTQAELHELHKMVEVAEVCALDTEASGKDPRNAALYGVAFSVRERQGVYVPLMQPDLDGVSQEEVRARVESIFRIKTRFVGHKIKFDYLILSSPNLDEALRANAVRDALLSRECPSPKQALQRLQQITEDEVLRTDLT